MERLSLEELKALKEKAGKAFLNAEAIKGGMVSDCHVSLPSPPPCPCDNV